MKLFSKARWTFVTLFTALLIPILVIGAEDTISFLLSSFWFTTNSNTYIAGLLAFLPMFLGLFTSILCGTQIPSEFKDRTAYLNISLPISRSSFYIGKYLAGLLLYLGIFMFAYGSAVATATMMGYGTIFTDLLGESLMVTIIAVFAYSATALHRFVHEQRVLFDPVRPDDRGDTDHSPSGRCPHRLVGIDHLPMFLGEAALGLLGARITGSAGMAMISEMDLTNLLPMEIVGVVWGIAFLIIGLIKTQRREM